MSVFLRLSAAAMALALPASGQAAWHEASTTHFVIYSDDDPGKLRDFATRLEMFDSAVRHARSMVQLPPGPGNRLTVFVLANTREIVRLSDRKDRDIAGFYQGRATGSVAFVPRRAGDGAKTDLDAETVFFHEYAHHLMMQELDQPYPPWLVEGFAEFLSTATFGPDGSVRLGAPALHRAWSLMRGEKIPMELMLAGNHGELSPERRASLYARGWLLTHYLTFEPSRAGQLDSYMKGIAAGQDPQKSAEAAFGDIRKLDRDIDAYLLRRRISYLQINASRIKVGPVDIRPLSAGAEQVMPLRIQSKRGVNEKTAPPLAAQVRAVAARHPTDPLVQVTLAEAEMDAGNHEAAAAAADRALAASPKLTEAMTYKGRAAMARAEKSAKDADWREARRWLLNANRLDAEDPEPLMLFYQSYVRQGLTPTRNAIDALHYASRLAPQDLGLRMTSAVQHLREGKTAEARLEIAPIAYNPHGGGISVAARRVLDLVEAGDVRAALQASSSERKSGDETAGGE